MAHDTPTKKEKSESAKDRRLVIVPKETREIVNTLAARSGKTFEVQAGEFLAKAAAQAYAEYIREEASRLMPSTTGKRRGK